MRQTLHNDIQSTVSAIQQCIRYKNQFVALHEPSFEGNEWGYVKECIDTGWVSSVGRFVDEFERRLAEYTGVKKAVAVVNGTAALHICLKLVGVECGDEVLIPALSFVATANAVAYAGAIPHFVDSEYRTLGLDPEKLDNYLKDIADVRMNGCYNRKTGRRIKAVVPMHTFGHPVDLDRLSEVCLKFRLELIEDAAESLGSFYKGKHTGNVGRVAALSFNGNKIVTAGGGGAILTNDEDLGVYAKHLTTTAKIPHPWSFVHDEIGYNYRLPNINAALACAQIEQIDRFLSNKRKLAMSYKFAFETVQGVEFFVEPDFAKSNYWLNAILLEHSSFEQRNAILQATNDIGIMTRPVWNLLNRLPMFKQSPSMDLSVAQDIEARLINIPSSSSLGGHNVET